VYIIDENACIMGRARRQVGVKDTAISGNNRALNRGLKDTFQQARNRGNQIYSDP
jgi:hypothetical protein